MIDQPSIALRSACRHLLRPIVSFLLKAGLPWKAFSDLSREVYVEVAGRDYGIDGRPTNVSRVSILTGLSRRQVRDQRALIDKRKSERASGEFRMNPATRVITAWHQDPDFANEGTPKILPREGDVSFSELLKRHGGDIPHIAMEKELKRVGAVEETESGELCVAKRVFMPAGLDGEYIRMFGAHLHDLAGTISHNVRDGSERPLRFQRVVSNENIAPEVADEFRNLVNKEGQALLERLDAWLSERESTGGDGEAGQRVGAGMYLFQNDEPE